MTTFGCIINPFLENVWQIKEQTLLHSTCPILPCICNTNFPDVSLVEIKSTTHCVWLPPPHENPLPWVWLPEWCNNMSPRHVDTRLGNQPSSLIAVPSCARMTDSQAISITQHDDTLEVVMAERDTRWPRRGNRRSRGSVTGTRGFEGCCTGWVMQWLYMLLVPWWWILLLLMTWVEIGQVWRMILKVDRYCRLWRWE